MPFRVASVLGRADIILALPRITIRCTVIKCMRMCTGSARVDCGGAVKFRRQWIDHGTLCTTSTRTATERLHTCTEDAPVLGSTQPCIPPGSLNRVPALAGVKAGMLPLPGGR